MVSANSLACGVSRIVFPGIVFLLPPRMISDWLSDVKAEAEVESSNTVGYQKIQLTVGFNMISPAFNEIGGNIKAIKNIFEEKTGWTAGEADSEADYIYIWHNGGYAYTYFVSSDADGAWANGEESFSETEDQLPENVGFWLYNRGSARTVTLAGEVPTEDAVISIIPGFTMVSNPFAAPIPVKSIAATSGEFVAGEADSEADYIYIWRNGGYDATYFVSSDADGAWANGEESFSETEDTIAPGEAFWFYRRGSAMTITIPCPN